ncbi:MAG: ATP-binding domain-containing protein, partial [Clostridia bacterium]|nr:ATP-binding domain-containing protein [Clostridia bacterium]
QNYRSTQNILDAANNVIKNNYGRKGKKLWTDKGKGERISVYKASNEHDEASFIAEKMESLSREGYSYNDMAVLYRANASSRALEEVFMRRAVPYRVLSGLRFYDRKEIRDMVAYLRLIKNPDDDISLKRIINTPSRKIGKVTLDKIAAVAQRENCSLLKAIGLNREVFGVSVQLFYDTIESLRNFSLANSVNDLINEVFEKTDYKAFLETDEKGEERIDNVYELINGAANYMENNEDATFVDYMDNLALISDIDNYDEELEAAVFMTMHASKGLEFPIVFICGFDEGIFPNSASCYISEELEEERRLCYVGITRAQQMLYITSAQSRMLYGKTQNYKPSRFLDEIPTELLEITDNTVKHNDSWLPRTSSSFLEKPENSLTFKKNGPDVHSSGESFRVGECVIHKKFGRGIIIDATPVGNDIHYEIAFESVGTKNLLGLYAKLQKA